MEKKKQLLMAMILNWKKNRKRNNMVYVVLFIYFTNACVMLI